METTYFDGAGFDDDLQRGDTPPPRGDTPPPRRASPSAALTQESFEDSEIGTQDFEECQSETCGLVPLTWRGMTFWGREENGVLVALEVYGSPLGGNTYRLVHDANDASRVDGWRLEVWEFGEDAPRAVISDHPDLKQARCPELLAAMAVMVEGNVPLSVMSEDKSLEIVRLVERWSLWMRTLPGWSGSQFWARRVE